MFPKSGVVYVLREVPGDLEDDDVIASVREGFILHTYRLKAKFNTMQEAMRHPDFKQVLEWMSAFAGSILLLQSSAGQLIDLASLLAEASRMRDVLLSAQTARPFDKTFRAGFESTEHMVLKGTLLNGLRRDYPNETPLVEELVEQDEDDTLAGQDVPEHSRRDKPDLRIGDRLWIEVETLRGLSWRGSNPFFALESKLRQKSGMRTVKQVWLIVPSDIALLASYQLSSLVGNLNAVFGEGKIRFGFADLSAEKPIFVNPNTLPPIEAKLAGASWRTGKKPVEAHKLTRNDIAGYSDVKELLDERLLDPLLHPEKYEERNIPALNGILLYGLPGCGKSLIGRVLAGEADLAHRFLAPSDMTSKWLGEGVEKIRELFDWALKQEGCLLVLDELDAVAPQRREANMHTDEKRQVNELLAQLDRIVGKRVIVVATTNYVRGIDSAIQRSGRFDIKLPIFPPNKDDRTEIFKYYLTPIRKLKGLDSIDVRRLAEEAILFTPADIRTAVQTAAHHAVWKAGSREPSLSTQDISQAIHNHPRSIRREMAVDWLQEASEELVTDHHKLVWLKEEITLTFGKDT